MQQVSILARQLRAKIGAHYRMIGDSSVTHDDYMRARSESDDAESTARYLIQYLSTAQAAVISQITGIRQ